MLIRDDNDNIGQRQPIFAEGRVRDRRRMASVGGAPATWRCARAGTCDDFGVMFVRYQAAVANANGRCPGVFAIANGLAADGILSSVERSWWRASNDWLNAAYPDPATVDASIFDRGINAATSCWFKSSACHLLERVSGCLTILDAHGIGWVELRRIRVGPVLYEDDVQVVVGATFPTTAGAVRSTQPARSGIAAR